MFISTKLQPLQDRIDEHRLRLEIWMSDCGVTDGNLSAITVDGESTLYNTLRTLFQGIHSDLQVIFQSIKELESYDKQSTRNVEQERYSKP
jgi:hypothetical protein